MNPSNDTSDQNEIARSPSRAMMWLVIGGAVGVFAVASYFTLDQPAARYVRESGTGKSAFWQWVTELGVSDKYLVGLAVFALLARQRKRLVPWMQRAWFGFFSIALSGLMVNGLKIVFGRARPNGLFLDDSRWGFHPFTTGYDFASFPSGHSTTAGALMVMLCVVWPRLSFLWVPLGILVGVSRVMVGAHYPSDVAVGLAFGAAVTLWVKRQYDTRDAWHRPAPRWLYRGVD